MRRCLLAASGLHRSRCIKCPSAPTIIEPSMHAVSEKSRLLIVTDPLCSWCWGTLPEIEATRDALHDVIDFDLMMGGLQVGPADHLTDNHRERLISPSRSLATWPPNRPGHTSIGCRPRRVVQDLHLVTRLPSQWIRIWRKQIETLVIRNFPSRGVIPNSILTNSLFLLRASSGNPNAALDCL